MAEIREDGKNLRILAFCRHKSAGWEGVIFREDDGRTRITNGVAVWDDSEKRRAALEEVKSVDLQTICEGLERYSLHHALLELLRTDPEAVDKQDQEYLAEPLVEELRFQISDEKIDIRCSGFIFVQARGPAAALEQKALLEQYQRVLQEGKARKVQISFSNHFRRRLLERWDEYLTAVEDRLRTYRKMMELAWLLERRGIHLGYCNDHVLQDLYDQHSSYSAFYHAGSPCQEMEWIARELMGLEQAFAECPDMRGRKHKIYL